MPRRYPPGFRRRALRLLNEALPDYESEFEAIRQVPSKLDVSTEALRKRGRAAEMDSGGQPGMTSGEDAELKQLKKENAELRRANGILKAASSATSCWGRDRTSPHGELWRLRGAENAPPDAQSFFSLTAVPNPQASKLLDLALLPRNSAAQVMQSTSWDAWFA